MLSRSLAKGRNLVIGIRREDPKRIWERRTPLTPDDVHKLLSKLPVEVHVAPCHRRVFPIEEYQKAGATVSEDLSNVSIVLGIKETPVHELDRAIKSKSSSDPQTHLMFSHTHKGQAYNTPLLARFVAPGDKPSSSYYPRLIDYELLTDNQGKRTVGFGWFAGVAGVLESLASMAQSHLEQGIASPFLYTPRPHTVPSLDDARTQLREIGSLIAAHGTPRVLGPFVIGLTGRGKVSQGCLSMLAELPIQHVRVEDLDALVKNPDTDLRKVYLVHVKPEEYLVTLDGRSYDRELYYSSPQSFKSLFHERVAPYLTLFLNGTGWSPGFPRLMSNEQLQVALDRARHIGVARFTNIGDISCDVEGGLEFLTKSTTLDSPAYKVRPSTLPTEYPSIQMMSVDILPASMPLDASKHFSNVLQPYLESLISIHTGKTVLSESEEYLQSLNRATIAADGKLTEPHQWLQAAVDKFYKTGGLQTGATTSGTAPEANKVPSPQRVKRILMLGSGMVAKPAVETIAEHPGMELIIASNSLQELQHLARPYDNVNYRVVDIGNASTYKHLIEQADVVISLLPVQFHPIIAEACIDLRKHLVTASYISPDMAKLDESARKADVLLLNEIGLDPGIDHCSAVELFSRIQAAGQKVVSFTSFCGGLPAPETSDVPLRYKFSWRPQGVLTATMNDAIFKAGNAIRSVSGDALLKSAFSDVPIPGFSPLEGIPNRDSLQYSDTYNLSLDSLRTIMRGTLRYPGFSQLMSAFISLGLLDRSSQVQLDNWTSFVRLCLRNRYPTHDGTIPRLQDIIPSDDIPEVINALKFLSLIPGGNSIVGAPSTMPPLPKEPMVPLDIFAYLLASKLRYQPGERDMVVLTHEVISANPEHINSDPIFYEPEGPKPSETVYTSTLIAYGDDNASAMSRTVGIPVAIAALNVAEEKIALRGVAGPTHPSVYEPVLEGLARVGLGMRESIRQVPFGSGFMIPSKSQIGTVEQTIVIQSKPTYQRKTPGIAEFLNKWKRERLEGKA